jgi:hypothetical protein
MDDCRMVGFLLSPNPEVPSTLSPIALSSNAILKPPPNLVCQGPRPRTLPLSTLARPHSGKPLEKIVRVVRIGGEQLQAR